MSILSGVWLVIHFIPIGNIFVVLKFIISVIPNIGIPNIVKFVIPKNSV